MPEKEISFEKILAGVKLVTGYTNEEIIRYYFDKLVTRVKDYCKREDLNGPLFDFIEKKLIDISTLKLAEEEARKNKASNNAVINGIGIKSIKSINRGDTSITLRDIENQEACKTTAEELLNFSKEDYYTLNRHRKVYRT